MNRVLGASRWAGRLALALGLGAALAQPTGLPPSSPPLPAPVQAQAPGSPASPPADPWSGDSWDDGRWAEIEQWAEDTATEETSAADAGAGATPGSEYSTLELLRQSSDGQQRRIRVVRRGTGDTSGIFTICQPREGEDPGGPSLAVFSESGEGGVEISIDKNLIRVPLALVTQRQGPDGAAGDGQIEAGGGAARFLEAAPPEATDRLSRCAVAAEFRNVPGAVQVTQGQTHLSGQSLKYSEADGIARIAGPITFSRRAQEGGPTELSGTAAGIEVDIDHERTVLVGDVVLNSSGGRVSRAARVEYDDAANLARLIGTPEQPAVSVRGQEQLQAAEILYDLERDEAVARASAGVRITGTFSDTP